MPLAMLRVPVRVLGQLRLDRGEEGDLFLARGAVRAPRGPARPVVPRCTSSVASPPSSRIMLGPWPLKSRMRWRVLPVLVHRLALVGEDRRAAGGDGGGSVVLGREDVAGGPAHVGAERVQRLDEDGGLDRHVQRAGDAGALQRLDCLRTRRGSPSAPASRTRRCSISLRPKPARPMSATLYSVSGSVVKEVSLSLSPRRGSEWQVLLKKKGARTSVRCERRL